MQNKSSVASDKTAIAISQSPFSKGLPALYAVAFLSGLSLGLFNPFISTFMVQHNIDDVLIGANSTVYFLVIAIGTPAVAKILRQIGLRRTMMLGFALMGLVAPLFPLTNQLSLWFIIRIFMGFACCLYLVSEQTALNSFCNDSNRAIVNGLDALFFSLGFGLGPIIGSVFYHLSPTITFALGGTLMLSGIVVVYFGLPERAVSFQSLKLGIFKKLFLPLQGGFAYGFSVATFVSLYPVYLLRNQYEIEQIGYTFTVFIVGGLLATIPITYLADRMGKNKVLLASVCLVVCTIIGLSINQDFLITQILAFLMGAGMSPILPLSLALVGARLSLSDLSSGSALFTAIYGLGCTAGPILSSIVMRFWGDSYFFSLMLVIFTLFCLGLLQQNQKKLHGM
jgi:MFS family permease